MGTWSANILGSDKALDYESDIQIACGYLPFTNEMDTDGDKYLTKKNLEKYQLDIFNKWKNTDATIIAFQVLAAHMVNEGAIFDKDVLEMCILCLERDEWAKISFERKFYIDYLLNVLKNYKNFPTSYCDNKIIYSLNTLQNVEYIISIIKNYGLTENVIEVKPCIVGVHNYGILFILDETKTPANFFETANNNYFDITTVYTS